MGGVLVLGGLVVAAVLGWRVLSGNARRPTSGRPRLHPETVARVRDWLGIVEDEHAPSKNVPASLILAVIARESSGDENASGSIGEVGLMQITRDAWLDYQRAVNDSDTRTFAALEVPRFNVRVGSWVVRDRIDAMGTVFDGLRAYNAGVTGARRDPTRGSEYARWILETAEPQLR